MVKVILDGVSKQFNGTSAVDKFNLEINDEEFMSILGPSGCGKTTLLRLIAGLEPLSEGRILFNDKVVNDVPPRDRNVAMVFQSYALFPHMTVAENIGFPLVVRKTPEEQTAERVKEIAELLRLTDLMERKPRALSGGEQQRVAVGRAIVRKPDVLLMDEPLSNVDAKTRAYLRAELKELQRDVKTTLLLVTHDQTEAMTMSNRIALMRYGKLVQLGSPEDIYEHPKDVWSGSFVGSLPMNLINSKIIDDKGTRAIEASCFAPQSPKNLIELLKDQKNGTRFTLGVRPEDIEISKKQISNFTCESDVHLLEPMGDSLIISLKIVDTLIRVKTKPGFEVSVGDHMYLLFDWNRTHLFLSENGAESLSDKNP
ncbi:MAG TPA: ABC transporter ATP-binding protein [Nitrososphaerales archaeon]|jgi:multiple sugar transport system ATP-binding protein|nr:ABC transporter ATP-binding protein [Nitrososphaerales archaeon]|tara:strand:- start:1742 stop:2851 length:1110 start_codon:yes stop_codon:yes gene_type:complete